MEPPKGTETPVVHSQNQGGMSTTPVNFGAAKQQVENHLASQGITKDDVRLAAWNIHHNSDPYGPNPFAQQDHVKWNAWDQGWYMDAISGIYNGLVIGLAEGVTNIIPTVAQAAGSENKIYQNWLDTTNKWFDKQKTVYSDEYYKPVKNFSDYFSSGKFWGTAGEGIGFILSLAAPTKGMKNPWSKRMTSFGIGTAQMYGSLYDTAIEEGFSPQDAARIGLATAGIVSLTEGAALEWIGKGATSFIPDDFAKTALRGTFKEGAKTGQDFYRNLKNFSGKLAQQLGSKEGVEMIKNAALKGSSSAIKGGAIEFGQEFSQTYIEDGLREMYDTFVSKTDKVDNNRMGSWEQFRDAAFSGIIGGFIGGGMGTVGSLPSGFKTNREAVLGYVAGNVQAGKMDKVNKLYGAIKSKLDNKQISEQDYTILKTNLDSAVKFAQDTKYLNLKDSVANTQLFDLMKSTEVAKSALSDTLDAEGLPDLVKSAYAKNAQKAGMITEKMEMEAKAIIDSGKKVTGSKNRFDKMMGDFKRLYADVINNKITDDQFNKRFAKIGIVSREKEDVVDYDQVSTPDFEGVSDQELNTKIESMQNSRVPVPGKKKKIAGMRKELEFRNQLREEIRQEEEIKKTQYGVQQKPNNQQQSEKVETTNQEQQDDQPISQTQEEVIPEGFRYVEEDEVLPAGYETRMSVGGKRAITNAPVKTPVAVKITSVSKKKPIIHEGQVYRVDDDGQIKNANTGHVINPESTIGKIVLEKDQKADVSSETQPELRPEIEADVKQKRADIESRRKKELEQATQEWGNNVDEKGFPKEALPPIQKRINEKYDSELVALEEKVESPAEEAAEVEEMVAEKAAPIESSLVTEADEQVAERIEETAPESIEEEFTKKVQSKKISKNLDFSKLARTGQLDLNFKSDPDIDFQITGFTNSDYDYRIAENPELFEKVRDHFMRIFPGVTVKLVDGFTDQYGNMVLGQVLNTSILLNKDNAFQSTLAHEFSEIYLSILQQADPMLYRRGLDFVRNSRYHEEAKIIYADYSPEVQLKEAFVQAVAENASDQLRVKFDGTAFDKFTIWLKNFWNRIKNFLSGKKVDVVQALANDLVLRKDPMMLTNPELSLSYQLGQKVAMQDPGMKFISNVTNAAILLSKFAANKDNKDANATDAYVETLVSIYDRYRSELKGEVTGTRLFNGQQVGPSLQDLEEVDPDRNFQNFVSDFSFRFPDRMVYIQDAIEKSLAGVVEREIDQSLNEIKASKEISANTRIILSSILDADTGSELAKEQVIRTVLTIADSVDGSQEFMNELDRRALKGNFVANRLKFILKAIGPEYSVPIVRELSSLEQVEETGIVLQKENGKMIFKKKIVNKDYNQEETINDYAAKLINAERSGKLAAHAKKIFQYSKLSDQSKAEAVVAAVKDIFQLSNFSYEGFLKHTNYQFPFLISLINEASKLGTGMDEKMIREKLSNYLKQIAIAETEMDVLQSNYVNMMGNRVSSIRLGSFFTNVRKNLNKKNYVTRLKNTALYKNNPVVQALDKGMSMKMSIHGAISNVEKSDTNEYSAQSTIDNKLNGLYRFAHSYLTKTQKQYDQWIGVTADRDYQTFFSAPFLDMVNDEATDLTEEGKQRLMESARRDQRVLDSIKSDWKALSPADLQKFAEVVQNLTIHKVEIRAGVPVIIPVTDLSKMGKYQADIETFINEIDSLGLTDAIENQTQTSIKHLVTQFFFNDYINRQALEDLFTGPLERHIIKTKLGKKTVKDISEPIKRMGLANGVGVHNELDKPVRVVYVDTKGISDSFSFNGSHLQKKLGDLGGAIDKVGSSIKDSLFQVDHFDEGRTVSMKMSTLGLYRKEDDAGMYNGHSFQDFTPEGNESSISISKIGDAIIALEDAIGNDPYVKIVDTDVTKNEIPAGAEVIRVEDFVKWATNGQTDEILKRSPEMKFTNYRTVFNLHKDISQVPLSEQLVKLGTQFAIIASNYDTKEELQQIETLLVGLLTHQLGNTPKLLNDTTNMVRAALMHADETQSTFSKSILEFIDEHNNRANVYEVMNDVASNQALDTKEKIEKEVKNRLRSNPFLDEVLEQLVDQDSLTKIRDQYMASRQIISTLDHPNVKFQMENTIANQLTKKGIDIKVAGNFLRVVPDFNEDLKDSDPETGEVAEIAVPWSMFGNTREQAEQKLKEANDRGTGLRTIAVRIPTGGNTMIFAAKVKYFIEGNSNNVITSKGFIERSDSDHDADKLFIYRQDLNDNGDFHNSMKSKLFEEFYRRVSSKKFIEDSHTQSVSVKEMITRASGVLSKLDALQKDVNKSLRTFEGTSQVANSMKDGLVGVGIFAVAVKTLSMLAQSGVKFKQELNLDLGIDLDGKQVIKVSDINISALEDAALYLQAALDNAKEMALGFTGVNKDNIGTVSAMLMIGLNVEQITAIINSPVTKKYMENINADASIFSLNEREETSDLRKKFKAAEKDAIISGNFNKLPAVDQVLFNIATGGDQKLDQPVQSELKDGFYMYPYTIGKKSQFYELKTLNGKKVVSRLNKDEAYNRVVAKQTNVLESYFTLENISREISKITPLIQLDGGLPNTGTENYKLQERMYTLQDDTKFDYFDVSPLLDRARAQHHMSMNTMMRNIIRKHFLTEHDAVYSGSKKLATQSIGGLRNWDYVKNLMADTIQTMYAQKLLSDRTSNMSGPELDAFYNGFSKKMQSIKNIIAGVNSTVSKGMRDKVNEILAKGGELKGAFATAYKTMIAEQKMNEEFSGTIENVRGESKLVSKFIQENAFLRFLDVVQSGTRSKVVMRKTFRELSAEEQDMVRNSYHDLVKYMPGLAAEILDYQLLGNGLNDKIGSYAAMLPQDIHTDYLQILSQKTADKDKIVEVQMPAYMINTAIRMKDILPELPAVSNKTEDGMYVKDGEVYIAQDGKVFNVKEQGSFMSNGQYYKFGDIKEFAKLILDKQSVTQEEVDEVLKNCFASNG